MKVKIRDLEWNPFRRKAKYPLNRGKIQALRESIEATSFWDNIVGRKNGDKIQIAYGHHRLAALQETFEPEDEVNMIVRDLNDEMMAKMMFRENSEDWASFQTDEESVRVAVEGYAEGRWSLRPEKINFDRGAYRMAPSFAAVRGSDLKSESLIYTAETVAKFTGISLWKIEAALSALAAKEKGDLPDNAIPPGMQTRAAQEATQQIIRVARKTKSRKAIKAVIEGIHEEHKRQRRGPGGGGGFRTYKAIADKVIRRARPGSVDYNKVADRYLKRLVKLKTENGQLFKDLRGIVKHQDRISAERKMDILTLLDDISDMAGTIAKALRPYARREPKALLTEGGGR